MNITTVYSYVQQGLVSTVKLPKRTDDRKRTDPLDTPRRKIQFRQQDLDRFIADHLVGESLPPAATGAVVKTGKRVIERGWYKRANA